MGRRRRWAAERSDMKGEAAYLADGTLAGSVATMDRVFRFLVNQVGLSVHRGRAALLDDAGNRTRTQRHRHDLQGRHRGPGRHGPRFQGEANLRGRTAGVFSGAGGTRNCNHGSVRFSRTAASAAGSSASANKEARRILPRPTFLFAEAALRAEPRDRRLHDRPTLAPRVTRSSSSCSNVSPIASAAPVPAASRASFEG